MRVLYQTPAQFQRNQVKVKRNVEVHLFLNSGQLIAIILIFYTDSLVEFVTSGTALQRFDYRCSIQFTDLFYYNLKILIIIIHYKNLNFECDVTDSYNEI